MDQETKGRAPLVLLAGAVAMVLLLGGVYLVNRVTPAPAPIVEKPLPMGPEEQAYAQQIHFLSPQMSRAANFLNQEVTFMFGTLSNDGPRAIRQIEVKLEFHDPFNQVVLRDTQRLFGPGAAPLDPHEQRDFQIGYEHMPSLWNQTYPKVQITGLDLQ